MKKQIIVILLGLFLFSSHAQDTNNTEPTKNNEISLNLLDLVVAGTLGINYERIFENNQSLFLSANIFDTYGYYDVGYIEDNSAFTLRAAYLVYFSKEKDHHGFFFYPQFKFRTGEITTEDYYFYDIATESEITEEFTYDIGGASAGFGIGHKWMFDNKFTLTLNGDIARNLGNFKDDYLENIELRFAVNFGYRF
ncbi:hypothetical protein [Winogradskyella alexanderae]|uniref:DUF3575 domain-containing protein n=1 Tax=Winogradskyella alexanderae TaxID=2877123 RepID=A0ABS7XNB8_9FLAO|nr:hypothetical protein [Winogradskyella alexanderae]MCA0131493.1 hypothetical protein [Winogradskyella alexanderae]